MRWLVAAAFLVAVPASADDLKAARAHYIRAVTAHSERRYDEAAREYFLAYQAKEDAALLFDAAEAHRLGAHLADALRFYRLYLVRAPGADNRAEVQRRIAELKEKLDPPPSPSPMPWSG